jgi:hypothetical protein
MLLTEKNFKMNEEEIYVPISTFLEQKDDFLLFILTNLTLNADIVALLKKKKKE